MRADERVELLPQRGGRRVSHEVPQRRLVAKTEDRRHRTVRSCHVDKGVQAHQAVGGQELLLAFAVEPRFERCQLAGEDIVGLNKETLRDSRPAAVKSDTRRGR